MSDHLALRPADAGLLVVDVQERLAAAMPASQLASCERRVGELAHLAGLLGLPVLVTEQYPKGLGRTVPALREALAAATFIEKTSFDCGGEPAFVAALEATGRRQWIVTGMEAHVCVFQTVRSLRARGLTVHVPEDAVSSRRPADQLRGLALMAAAGAVTTTAETAIFDLLGDARSPHFKDMSARLRAL
jgi:nicotinamidase-related amidase